MLIQLSDSEYDRIERYSGRLQNAQERMRALLEQSVELADVINTSWRDAYRRVKLERPELQELSIPEMIGRGGKIQVKLNQDRMAEWSDDNGEEAVES